MVTVDDDVVHVWCTRPGEVSASALASYRKLLSPTEAVRNARFVFETDRDRDLVARALVRTTLSRYSAVEPRAWVFEAGPYGKPEIAEPVGARGLRFSLTHTDGLVALAVTLHRDIGLDAEHLGRHDCGLDVAPRFFAPAEVNDLRAASADEQHRRFLEYWTLKEAYIKAVGAGLSMQLDSFAMQLTNPPGITFAHAQDDSAAWHFARLRMSGEHLVALAVRDRHRVPVVSVHWVVP
jgi:4'-phosphopantetheinyl transferase